jgi:hypothetical protein
VTEKGARAHSKEIFYAYIRNLHISALSPQWYRVGEEKLEWIWGLSLHGATILLHVERKKDIVLQLIMAGYIDEDDEGE